MRQLATLLSRLLAIASAAAALMGVTTIGHSLLTPQTRLPRLHDEAPNLLLRAGLGALGAAVVLGLLGYLVARIGSEKPR